jgi:hypothetical protein
MRYTQLFRITGVANSITYDSGLKSTETEKKRLISVYLQMAAQAATDDNDIQGWHERAKVFELPEKLIPSQAIATTTMERQAPDYLEQQVDMDIPIGEIFKVAIKCSATLATVRGIYNYEIIK